MQNFVIIFDAKLFYKKNKNLNDECFSTGFA